MLTFKGVVQNGLVAWKSYRVTTRYERMVAFKNKRSSVQHLLEFGGNEVTLEFEDAGDRVIGICGFTGYFNS